MNPSVKRKKIVMVVEDEALLLEAIHKKLLSAGFEVISCTKAKKALDWLSTSKTRPDVIWLDYYLGDMNGLEFMNELKKNTNWSFIPVVVVSNSASEQKKNSMLALGAKEYILKAEHKLDDIISTINGFI